MRKDLGPQSFLYPMPVLIIGTYDENGKADAMNAAWGSIYDYKQITISLGSHVTTDNIRKNKAFTVSFGTRKTVAICDYVGIVSMADQPNKLDKAGLHPVKSLKVNAPLFEEFPLSIECELISLEGDMGDGGTLIGQIINMTADESILTNGKIDVKKLEPICFEGQHHKYHVMGEEIADGFKIGLTLK